MATSTDNKEQQQKMSNSSDRLPYHVSFNDDQRQQQQRKNSITIDDLSSTSRQGLSLKINQ
jgi:hypothetical protein